MQVTFALLLLRLPFSAPAFIAAEVIEKVINLHFEFPSLADAFQMLKRPENKANYAFYTLNYGESALETVGFVGIIVLVLAIFAIVCKIIVNFGVRASTV